MSLRDGEYDMYMIVMSRARVREDIIFSNHYLIGDMKVFTNAFAHFCLLDILVRGIPTTFGNIAIVALAV